MVKTKIHVCGFPRSGTMWLTRLVGDALDCPIHFREFSEGMERQSNLSVCHSHSLPSSFGKDDKVLRIVRDPRDVAVSHAKYWRRPFEDCVARMCRNHCRTPRDGWHIYETAWLESDLDYGVVRYEDLLASPEKQIRTLFKHLGLRPRCDSEGLPSIIEYRSFENEVLRQNIQNPLEPLELLWRGQAGTWSRYFYKSLGARAEAAWGSTMRQWDYTQSDDWWRSLPDEPELRVQV